MLAIDPKQRHPLHVTSTASVCRRTRTTLPRLNMQVRFRSSCITNYTVRLKAHTPSQPHACASVAHAQYLSARAQPCTNVETGGGTPRKGVPKQQCHGTGRQAVKLCAGHKDPKPRPRPRKAVDIEDAAPLQSSTPTHGRQKHSAVCTRKPAAAFVISLAKYTRKPTWPHPPDQAP